MFGCLPWWFNIEWRTRKRVMLLLCAFEFIPTIAGLVFFGIADPDTYRTQLWQEGANHGWNSDPIELLYAAANYRPISPPTPWNQFTTDWGLIISVLSTFILLVKIVMYLTHVFPPILSAVLHGVLVIFWAYAVSLQSASDYSDPAHPSAHPWMLTHGCGAPVNPALTGYCQQSVGALAVSCIQIALFLTFFFFSVVSAFPSEAQKAEQREKEREEQEWRDIENYKTGDFEQELDQMHLPPQMQGQAGFPAYPMSPSKSAFGVYQTEVPGPAPMVGEGRLSVSSSGTGQMARLNRDLPLRHHITSDVYA